MFSTVDVLEYLAAYAKGPQAYAAFIESLAPTHDYDVTYESRSSTATWLCREHHVGSMRRRLAEMDGSDPWAVVLSARPPAGYATSLYLQAAGTAEAMGIEFCRPGGTEIGAVSVRSVVGHSHTGPADLDVEIMLPRSTQLISRHEVFTAEEAADMFERFYRTDAIGDEYTLRPIEGYTAEGGHIDLSPYTTIPDTQRSS